jgi:hypothetical protein
LQALPVFCAIAGFAIDCSDASTMIATAVNNVAPVAKIFRIAVSPLRFTEHPPLAGER